MLLCYFLCQSLLSRTSCIFHHFGLEVFQKHHIGSSRLVFLMRTTSMFIEKNYQVRSSLDVMKKKESDASSKGFVYSICFWKSHQECVQLGSFNFHQLNAKYCKVGCVFSMVVVSILPSAEWQGLNRKLITICHCLNDIFSKQSLKNWIEVLNLRIENTK